MKLLLLSNLAPSPQSPSHGLFVQNQVDALQRNEKIDDLLFIAVRSVKKGAAAVLLKYFKLMFEVLVKAVLSRKTYDVIHVHYFYPTIWAALLYKLLRNPQAKIVVTFHGSDIYCYEPPPKHYRWASRFVDQHIFVSEGLQQRFFREDINSAVLSAGILDSYQPRTLACEYDIVMVGNLLHNKGIDRLLQILDAIEQPLKVAIVGMGPMEQVLHDYNSERHQLDLKGKLLPEQLQALLSQSRFLLSLSRDESFGLVMCEAMACGTPVIATKTDGSLTQVVDGQNGYLLDNDDRTLTGQAAQLIIKALAEHGSQKYKQMAKQCVADAQPYKLSRIIDSLTVIYQRLNGAGD